MKYSINNWLLKITISGLLCLASHAYANTWLVVGDSISAAYGMAIEEGWVALLEERLAQEAYDISVVNASISGDTTAGGLARLPALLEEHQPSWVLLELGGNDGLRGLPIAQMKKNLRDMVLLAQHQGAQVLLLGMRIPPNYGERYSNSFYMSYQELAKEENILLLEFFLQNVGDNSDLMQEDGIHPTKEAQPQLLNNVWPLVERILAK